jgi:chaperonin GroES
MKFEPLFDRVAVELLPSEEKTLGGIIIPDTAQSKSNKGKVVAVGKGSRDKDGNFIPMELQVGDEVIFNDWGHTKVKIDGKELLLMKEGDVIGVVK